MGLIEVLGHKIVRDILYWGEEVPVETIEARIDSATPEDILRLAREQGFSSSRSLSVLGPEKE